MMLRIIDGPTVASCLPMPACIDLMEKTMVAVSRGETIMPQRSFVSLPSSENVFGVMPGAAANTFGAKLISIFPDNPASAEPAIQGGILLFDRDNGAPVALVDAASVTAIRTAAASGMATRALAREDAAVLAILGCGVQAHSHLEAMIAVRPIEELRVWGRSLAKAEAFVDASQGYKLKIRAVATPQQAVRGADLICTVTGAREPVLRGDWLEDGAHINLVGAHSPHTREADTEAVARARFFAEIKAFAMKESGDILIPISEGVIGADHLLGEIGQVLTGQVAGRLDRRDITMYKSLGNVAQDLAAAHAVYEQARESGRGASVSF